MLQGQPIAVATGDLVSKDRPLTTTIESLLQAANKVDTQNPNATGSDGAAGSVELKRSATHALPSP